MVVWHPWDPADFCLQRNSGGSEFGCTPWGTSCRGGKCAQWLPAATSGVRAWPESLCVSVVVVGEGLF